MSKEEKVTIIEEDAKYEEGNETKQLVFKHMDRLSKYLFSGEPIPNYSEDVKGNVIKKSDRRMVIIGAIEYLICLVKPHYDTQMEEKDEEFRNDLKKVYFETQLHLARKRARFFVSKYYDGGDDKTNEEYFRELEETAKKMLNNTTGGFFLDRNSNDWEEYLDKRLECHMKILEDINFLLYRKNWLSQADYEE